MKNIFASVWKNRSLDPPKENKFFFQTKKQFFMTVVKNNFANKKFIILCKKVKAAHFSCVFNRAVMLFHSKLNKLIRVIVSYFYRRVSWNFTIICFIYCKELDKFIENHLALRMYFCLFVIYNSWISIFHFRF